MIQNTAIIQIVASIIIILTLTTTYTSAEATTTTCNGHIEYCSQPLNRHTFAATHNSFSVSSTSSLPGFANHFTGILEQLNGGVRAFDLDVVVYKDDLYLCHGSCDGLNAGTLLSTLTIFKNWLSEHPRELIILQHGLAGPIENYQQVFEKSGILEFAYKIPEDKHYQMKTEQWETRTWPTLGDLIFQNQRAVLFMDFTEIAPVENTTFPDYIVPVYKFRQATIWGITDERDFNCEPMDPPSRPGALLFLNHYLYQNIPSVQVLLPKPSTATVVNSYASVRRHIKTCTDIGIRPNFLFVDWWETGNWMEAVCESNGVSCPQTNRREELNWDDEAFLAEFSAANVRSRVDWMAMTMALVMGWGVMIL